MTSPTNEGKQMTFFELLKSSSIVIPTIQRDYAQGRIDKGNKPFYSHIRVGFVESLYEKLVEDNFYSPLVLDYIYGSEEDVDRRFLPIDGQQRLTTLFLLHWYIALKEGKFDELATINGFSYEVRDSAIEFCNDLLDKECGGKIPLDGIISKNIINASWYYNIYKSDPTVSSMLVMLDEINAKFGSEKCPVNIWERLVDERRITFWQLTLIDFGLTDDLFIKMNSRGKRLTSFESFKSDFEGLVEKCGGDAQDIKKWKNNIDNEWPEAFIIAFSDIDVNEIENAMFRYIIFIAKCLETFDGTSKYRAESMNELDDFDYSKDVTILSNPENLKFLILALDYIHKLTDTQYLYIKEKISSIAKGIGDVKYSERAKVFCTIMFDIEISDIGKYPQFERVLDNLIKAHREVDQKTKIFRNNLDNINFGKFILMIEKIIYEMKNGGASVNDVLISTDFGTNLSELSEDLSFALKNEIEKAKYIIAKGNKEILKLEKSDMLKSIIHNFLVDGELLFDAGQFDDLLKINKRLLLRAIQSYSEKPLIVEQYYGKWKNIAPEKVSGFYYEGRYLIYYFGFNAHDDGDLIWTSNFKNDPGKNEIISKAVKAFIKNLSSHKITEQGIRSLVEHQTKNTKLFDLSYYLSSYDEFYGEKDSTTCLIPHENYAYSEGYSMRILKDGKNFEKGHYNPYYKALANILVRDNSYITVKSGNDSSDKFVEDYCPLILSNGMRIKLLPNNDWKVYMNGMTLSDDASKMLQSAKDFSDTFRVLSTKNSDCIITAAKLIKVM